MPASLLQELLDEWTYWCNRPQFAPEGDWRCWVFLGGRGAGKTRAGAEWGRRNRARLLADRRAAIETLAISVGPAELALEAGDRVSFGGEAFEIARIEDAEARHIELRRARSTSAAMLGGVEPNSPPPPLHAPTPVALARGA